MNRYRLIIAEFGRTPLMLLPEKARQIADFLALKAQGADFTPQEIEARIGRPLAKQDRPEILSLVPMAVSDKQVAKQPGSVAVLQVRGLISQRISAMDDISGPGGTSTERVGAAFRQAVNDPNVKAVVLDIDSPGGSVYGVAELAALIRDSRGSKPIVAQVNSMAASAAYYIASAADEIVVTPSGEVGSIGVYCMHQDWSKALEQEGVAVQLISAGKFKTEGNPYEPLSQEARDAMQARVNDYYDAFVRDVAAGRKVAMKTVRDGFGEGRVVGAQQAVDSGMADKIATLDQTLSRFGVKTTAAGAKAQAPAPAWSCATEGHEHAAEEEAAGCVAETEAALAQGNVPDGTRAEFLERWTAPAAAETDFDLRQRRQRRRATA